MQPPTPNELSIQAAIDPAIQGKARSIMTDALRNLPLTYRQNVVLIANDGNVYATSPALEHLFGKAESLGNRRFRDTATGRMFTAPQLPTQPLPSASGSISTLAVDCTSDGTGPFRRMVTSPGTTSINGYGYSLGQVDLPSGWNSSLHYTTGKENFYIMLGGWGNNGSGTLAGATNAIDAGLQFDHVDLNGDGTLDNTWALFIMDQTGARNPGPRYQWGQTVTMEFWVPQDGRVAIRVSGTLAPQSLQPANVDLTNLTVLMDQGNWRANGYGNVLKRETTLGQDWPSENLSSGAYMLNAFWDDAKLAKSVGNPTPTISQSLNPSYLHEWGQFGGDIAPSVGTMCKYPNNSKVTIDNWTSYMEGVSIDLR